MSILIFMDKHSRGIGKRKIEETLVLNLLRLSGLISIITTVGIISILGFNSFPFFREVGFLEFFTGLEWTPLCRSRQPFPAWPIQRSQICTADNKNLHGRWRRRVLA